MAEEEELSIVDRILRGFSFDTLSFEEKKAIKSGGRPQPNVNINRQGRVFSVNWYSKVDWLTGSKEKTRLFCWPCLLFSSTRNGTWTKYGFEDVKNLERAVQRHSKSKDHVSAQVKLNLLGRVRIEHVLDEGARLQVEKHNQTVRKNRAVLERLIDTTTLLARQELAFRGRYENASSDNKGNYREFLECQAKHDELLATHLQTSTVFSGTSNRIQNDLIHCIASVVSQAVKTQIDAAPFFAWQVDETTDISNQAQLSISVRYVDGNAAIQERFVGFFNVSGGRDAQSVYEVVATAMAPFRFEEKLVAQTYDGAAVMASALNGLQAKVKAVAPSAMFVHCYAHRLNLVLSQGAKSIPSVRVFFANLGGFATFFSHSSKRTALLEEVGCSRLPKSAPTRWNFNSRAVSTVAENREKLLNVFRRIVDAPAMDDDTVRGALGFIGYLENFEFMFFLSTFKAIFSLTDVVFDIVQNKAMDIAFCRKKIDNLLSTLVTLGSEDRFTQVYDSAAHLPDVHAPKRSRAMMKEGVDVKEHYRLLYMSIIDNQTKQIKQRFADLDNLKFLQLLNNAMFEQMCNVFPVEALHSLITSYGQHFDTDRLKSELQVFYSDRDLHGENGKLCDLLRAFKSNDLDMAMPELYKLMCLGATIGATSAGVERSFSCLKRTKNYMRSATGQKRLSELALLSIEKSLVKALEGRGSWWYDQVTEKFNSMKERRVDFTFKPPSLFRFVQKLLLVIRLAQDNSRAKEIPRVPVKDEGGVDVPFAKAGKIKNCKNQT
ncbi:zinc finger MYM-type protein 1-like [Triplophysa dalaica]|uniref:zinc finger MYM-type protein 1-like n=1 Tax=Triplophysa dalaica TaxID=1582913 RepID=UPI0024DFA7D7|nr:zinc finger MYM-type protein 1-like [Triplophysa dalaica]